MWLQEHTALVDFMTQWEDQMHMQSLKTVLTNTLKIILLQCMEIVEGSTCH